MNRLLSVFKTKPTRFKCYKSFFHELQGRYGYLFAHLRARFMPKKSFDTLADNLHDVMVETLPALVDKHIKEQVVKQVPEQNPLFTIKECRLVDRCIKRRLVVHLDSSQQLPHDCVKSGNTVESCGNGAHIGYNCPPKAPIISNPEQCNQTINELPQTLPSVHPTCNYEDENSFTYDSKPNSFNDSPSVLTHPPQLQFETYLCELCGNNAHYGYDCPPQFPLVYEQEPCYNQTFNDNYFPQNSQSSFQQYICCENCGGPHETFQCQPMNEDYYEQNSCYYPNSFGFNQYQPPQFPVNYPPQEKSREILQAQEDLMEALQAFLKEYDHIPPNEKCMALLRAEERFLKI
ncbi:hypothetical protein Tco_0390855 [Tanacetum coccineum]